MSEHIPESIPTSADPRSKRPLKKRALTPVSEQAASVDALFKKPDQEIRLPSSSTSLTTQNHNGAPPEIVANVQGSSAGAGSGEFHVYKASRRREYERLRAMDEEVQKEKDGEGWERDKLEREIRDREKTEKNRKKREKLKMKKGGKGVKVDGGVGGGSGGIGKRVDALGAGIKKEDEEMEGAGEVQEVVGVIIHDDD